MGSIHKKYKTNYFQLYDIQFRKVEQGVNSLLHMGTIVRKFLPSANEVWARKCFYTCHSVFLFTGEGACMVGGHAWLGICHMVGKWVVRILLECCLVNNVIFHASRRHVWLGACMVGGMHGWRHAWLGNMHGGVHGWGMCSLGACMGEVCMAGDGGC